MTLTAIDVKHVYDFEVGRWMTYREAVRSALLDLEHPGPSHQHAVGDLAPCAVAQLRKLLFGAAQRDVVTDHYPIADRLHA